MADQLEYECSEGHWSMAPADVTMERCPGYKLGSPCKGTMKRIGKGSKGSKTSKDKDSGEVN